MRVLMLCAVLFASPVLADEIEEAMQAALEAYRAGDAAVAKEELDYAAALLGQMKAEGLADLLPAPLDGWAREDEDAESVGAAMFGGGQMASAAYRRDGVAVEIQIMADNPMVASMGAMLANPQMMAAQGEVRRKGRQRYLVSHDQEIMALIANRVLVQVQGDAALEDKLAYFDALDLDALGAI